MYKVAIFLTLTISNLQLYVLQKTTHNYANTVNYTVQ